MSTPVSGGRKYEHLALGKPPAHIWSAVLNRHVQISRRVLEFQQSGFETSVALIGELKVIPTPVDSVPRAVVGSRMPFELATTGQGTMFLSIHSVQYSDRHTMPLSARVIVYLSGGLMKEFTSSATVSQPVLAIQAWPYRPKHLTKATMSVDKLRLSSCSNLSSLGGPSVLLTAALIKPHSRSTVILPFHTTESKWVCPTCGKLFSSAFELAKHDNESIRGGPPRHVMPDGRIGNIFKAPTFRRADNWKKQVLKALERGDVEMVSKLAPTCNNRAFRSTVTKELLKFATP